MFTLRVPCEVVKTRAMTGRDTSPIEAARCIMRTGGPGAFFTGYWGLALVEYPFNIVEVCSSQLESWEASPAAPPTVQPRLGPRPRTRCVHAAVRKMVGRGRACGCAVRRGEQRLSPPAHRRQMSLYEALRALWQKRVSLGRELSAIEARAAPATVHAAAAAAAAATRADLSPVSDVVQCCCCAR
jgi:hypothetical protein